MKKHPLEGNMDLDEEELFWLDAAKKGLLKPAEDSEEQVKMLREAARNTLRKNARISLRLTNMDAQELKRLAAREGIPYQTYIASILHKFVNKQIGPVNKGD